MRVAGFFLLTTGWLIAVAAVLLLRTAASRAIFSIAALAIEGFGLGLISRTHLPHNGERFD